MQTRKRAKPVTFGKAASTNVTNANEVEKEETKVSVEKTEETANLKEKEAVIKKIQEEHPASEEITRENIGASIEEAHLDDEPEAISLSAKEEPSEESTSTTQEEEKTEPSFSSFTKQNEPKQKKGSLGFFLTIVFVAFLLGLGGMIGFAYVKDANIMKLIPSFASPTSTPSPTRAPTPTEVTVDKSVYTIRVLNGSGVSGLAAETKKLLEQAEFVVGSVGNADNSNYTKTVLMAKEGVKETYLNALIKTLQKKYDVDSVIEDAPSSQKADVVVIIGSDKAE